MDQTAILTKILDSSNAIEDEAQRVKSLLRATNILRPDRADQVLTHVEELIDMIDDPETAVPLYAELVAYKDRVEARRDHNK